MSYHDHSIFMRSASPFAPEQSLHAGRADVFEHVAIKHLDDMLTGKRDCSAAMREGALFVSAVLFGALLDRRLWPQWSMASRGIVEELGRDTRLQRIRSHPDTSVMDYPVLRLLSADRIWVDMSIVASDGRWERRRWMADPLTHCLLLRWQGGRARTLRETIPIEDALALFLGEDHRPDDERQALLAAFHAAALARWRQRMPAFLVDAASEEGHCVSLPPERWAALFGRAVTPIAVPRSTYKVQKRPRPRDAVLRLLFARMPASRADPPKAFVRAAAALRNDASATSSPIDRLLLLWAADRLDPRPDPRQQRRHLAPSTVEDRARRLLPMLRQMCGAEDPRTWTATRWANCLDAFIKKRIEEGQWRGKDRDDLSCFMDWLQRLCPHIAVKWQEDTVRRESGVTAEILTAHEYEILRSRYDSDTINGAMARLLISLGFRAGLRWHEAVGLRLDDLRMEGDHVELVLRDNSDRRIKTRAGHRIVPLHLLLSTNERVELVDWWRSRCAEVAAGLPNAMRDPDDQMRVFPTHGLALHQDLNLAIRDALRSITGNRKAVFHDLRHSCGSYLLATLALPDDISFPYPAITPELVSHTRRAELAEGLLGSGSTRRAAVNAVGAVLGHSGDAVTIRSYMHLHDWLVGIHVARAAAGPLLPATSVAVLLDRSVTAIERAHRRAIARERAAGTPELHAPTPLGRPPRGAGATGAIALSRLIDDRRAVASAEAMPPTRTSRGSLPAWQALAIWMLARSEPGRRDAECQIELSTPIGRATISSLRDLLARTTNGRGEGGRKRFAGMTGGRRLSSDEAAGLARLHAALWALRTQPRQLLIAACIRGFDQDRNLLRVHLEQLDSVLKALIEVRQPVTDADVVTARRTATIRLSRIGQGARTFVWACLFVGAAVDAAGRIDRLQQR